MNDEPLLDRTLAGDSAAYGLLVRKYQDRLHRSIKHYLGSADEASDVCQEAFVQAFVKLESFQRNASFYTWLYRIALNQAATHRRRRKPTASLDELRASVDLEPTGQEAPPDARLLQHEQTRRVHEALAALGDEFRAVVVLRELEEMSYEEISQVLDLPVGTVRSRLFRAREQLRALLRATTEAS